MSAQSIATEALALAIPADHQRQLDQLRAGMGQLRANITQVQAGRVDRRFIQYGWTHTTAPDIGTPVKADNLDWYPSDRSPSHKLRDLYSSALVNSSWKFRHRCDEYEGPDGLGYWIVVQTSIDGTVYEYRQEYDADGVKGEPTDWVEISA